jgi:hypothetical protein
MKDNWLVNDLSRIACETAGAETSTASYPAIPSAGTPKPDAKMALEILQHP